MSENIPVLPIAGGTLVRAFLAVLALVTRWLKAFARARRHRREAAARAGGVSGEQGLRRQRVRQPRPGRGAAPPGGEIPARTPPHVVRVEQDIGDGRPEPPGVRSRSSGHHHAQHGVVK